MKWSPAFLLVLLARVCSAQDLPPVLKVGEISPAKYEVLEERDQQAPMRDGVQLRVDLFRPRAEGRFPAILWQTPYNKSGGAARAQKFAARGYVVVNVDVRGRFDSEGQWDPFSPSHKTDGYDSVEWTARQPWCSGNVGTFGLSYMGWTRWWTASQSPPSLKAIVPEVAPPDHFYNCPYQNGIFVCWMMDWAGMMSARRPHSAGPGPYGGFAVNREAAYRQLPYIAFDKSRGYQPTPWWRTWMLQNTAAGEYWRAIAYQTPESYAGVKVPSLAITGWFDANFPGAPMNYLGMKQHGGTPEARRPRMIVGPWEHIINTRREAAGVDFGPQAIIDWDGYVCRWFDYHLKGIDNQVLADPPIQVFVMGRNQWRSADDWPLSEAVPTKYYLHTQGHANSSAGDGRLDTQSPGDEPPDHYTYDPNDPTPSPAFANGHIDGPRDVSGAASRPDVLVYSTPVLDQDVEVVGPISARLFAATSARDTDWMIRLVDVHPDGRALFLAEGVMRARHRDDQRRGAFNPERLSSIDPDRVYEYAIDFWRPTGNVFAKGHRIRVEISSSYYPYYLRNLNTGEDNLALATQPVVARQTIRHDADHPSHIVLPVVPCHSQPVQAVAR
jgi:putative CocE/NonD family hydrolase